MMKLTIGDIETRFRQGCDEYKHLALDFDRTRSRLEWSSGNLEILQHQLAFHKEKEVRYI